MTSRRALILMVPLAVLPSITTAQQPNTGAGSPELQNLRGQTGQRLAIVCPPGQAPAVVHGTDVYADNSSICAAAVHAGVITSERGGAVTVVIGPGQERYAGSSRNGVTSQEFAAWPGSFSFDRLRATGERAATTGPAPNRAVAPPAATRAAPTAPVLRAEPPQAITTTPPNPTRAGVAPRGELRPITSSPPKPAPAIVSATGFKGLAGPKYSQLSWSPAPGAIGYGLTRYDPTTQQRVTLHSATGDTVFAATAYTDTAVTPNRTYGYRLRTHFHDANGDLVSDPDTSQGVSVTPKDPSAPLALPPDFQDSVRLTFTLTPPDPNRPSPTKGDTVLTLFWNWRSGAQGFRINAKFLGYEMVQLVGYNGWLLNNRTIEVYGKNSSEAKYVGPYASTQLRWPTVLHPPGTYLFCVRAASPVDPTIGRRIESRPGMLKLDYSYDELKWKVEAIDYYGGFNSCPNAPALFAEGK